MLVYLIRQVNFVKLSNAAHRAAGRQGALVVHLRHGVLTSPMPNQSLKKRLISVDRLRIDHALVVSKTDSPLPPLAVLVTALAAPTCPAACGAYGAKLPV